MTDKALLPIAEMAAGYQNGSLTPSEVIEDTLGRIEKLEPKIGAFEIVLADQARAAAEAASRFCSAFRDIVGRLIQRRKEFPYF